MSTPAPSKLSKVKFTANVSGQTDPSVAYTRTIRRIHIAEKVLAAARICADDAIVLRRWKPEAQTEPGADLEARMEGVSLNDQFGGDDQVSDCRCRRGAGVGVSYWADWLNGSSNQFVVGRAWPSFVISKTGKPMWFISCHVIRCIANERL